MNIRKAAVLLTALPQEVAASVMGKLKAKEVETVSIEIAQLGSVSTAEQEQVIVEFSDVNLKSLENTGNLELAQRLVEQALGKDAGGTIDNLRQSINALPFGFLRKMDPAVVQSFLVDEHPQTIALILSHLSPNVGAAILNGLPADEQISVIQRIALMGQTSPEVVQQVEAGLEVRMKTLMSQSFEHAGGPPTVAEILNVTDRSTGRTILDNLADEDPDLVEEIRRLMFVFDDIGKLADKDIQSLLRSVETGQWAMALKGASSDIRDKVLGNMSQRAAQMLSEEMEFLGAVRLSEVEEIQQQIVDIVRHLEDAGEITRSSDDEEDEFVS
jgi:flagellar motor switch protein FliG